MTCRHRRAHGLAILLLLGAAPLFPCTPSVNMGFPGNAFVGVIIMEPLPPNATVEFTPAGLVVSNIRHNGTNLVFDLMVAQNAPPGVRESICRVGVQEVRNPTAFTVLPAQTPTPTATPIPPTATPTAPPPTPTPTQPPPTATVTPTATRTATPPGPTPTPTATPPGPTPTRVAGGLRVAPSSIAAGSRSLRLIIAGTGFTSQTRVTTPPDVSLERVNPLSPTRIEIVVSTPPGAPSGPRVILVDTPGVPPGTAVITVVPPESLSAQVSVTTASIVHPRPGSFLMLGDQVFPKGLLATTGTGPVIGAWTFDGVPFDRFDVHASGGDPIPIEAKVPIPISTEGDHRLQLVIERPQLSPSGLVQLVVVPRVASRLRLIAPADGATVDAPPLFRWTLVPGAQAYELVFGPERQIGPDAPSIRVQGGSARLTERQLREVNKIPLLSDIPLLRFFWSVRPVHPVNVRGKPAPAQELIITIKPRIIREGSAVNESPGFGGAGSDWGSQTQEPPRAPPPPATATGPVGGEARGDWKVDLGALASVISGNDANERDTVHATLSSSSSFLGDTWSLEETADLAGHHQIDPSTTTQDSRNWLLRGGGGGTAFRADGVVGYSAPESADGLRILATGFTRGGVEVRLTTPAGRISGYQTFDDELGGIFSSTLGDEQRIRFGSWEAPLPSDRFLLRAVYLDTRDDGDPFELLAPTEARAYGAIGRWTVSPAFAVTLEGAHSKLESDDAPDRSGHSLLVNLGGIVSATRWLVNIFSTDGGFSNPANPSLTSFVQPDRVGGDFGLSRIFGKLTAGLGYRYVESGAAEGSRAPDARDHSATLTFSMPFSPKVLAAASGTWAITRADAGDGEVGPIPETDRAQYGGQFSLTETLGRLVLSQRLSWTELADDVSPDNDVTTQSGQLTANGSILPTLVLASSVALTRNETPLGGKNDQLVLMVQPTWFITPIRLTLAPRASYARNKNGITGRAPRAEHYQALLSWTPVKAGRLEGTVGLSSEWIRTVSGVGPRPSFDRRYVGTLAIRWGAGIPSEAPAVPAALDVAPFRPAAGALAERLGSAGDPGSAGWRGF